MCNQSFSGKKELEAKQFRAIGKSIIMISEEIMELLGMADRILIMKDGKINGEFYRSEDLKDTDLIDNMI